MATERIRAVHLHTVNVPCPRSSFHLVVAAPSPRVLVGSLFFPRGGSANVSANLARKLPRSGWDVTLVTGSVRTPGGQGDPMAFYAGLDVHPVDMTQALSA